MPASTDPEKVFFFEVLVRPFFPAGQPYYPNEDTGKYRTFDMVCTSDNCYFDRARGTGIGG